mmetsp:Transcript_149189/g.278133  ORF Transcript_149189/g.278133 Transcript_149189/m.278133 type:complete len:261 (-) Transcript_149189:708-1490(-)
MLVLVRPKTNTKGLFQIRLLLRLTMLPFLRPHQNLTVFIAIWIVLGHGYFALLFLLLVKIPSADFPHGVTHSGGHSMISYEEEANVFTSIRHFCHDFLPALWSAIEPVLHVQDWYLLYRNELVAIGHLVLCNCASLALGQLPAEPLYDKLLRIRIPLRNLLACCLIQRLVAFEPVNQGRADKGSSDASAVAKRRKTCCFHLHITHTATVQLLQPGHLVCFLISRFQSSVKAALLLIVIICCHRLSNNYRTIWSLHCSGKL